MFTIYIIMTVLATISTVVTLLLFMAAVICAEPRAWLFFLVALIITIGLWIGYSHIVNANTITTVETVDMEVTHCDIKETTYCISVTDGERHLVVEVSESQYAQTAIGDMVQVEITTRVNTLDHMTKITASMKGEN